MSDLRRLLEVHPSPLARSLLAGALDDEPPPSLLHRTLASAGIASRTATADPSTAATSSATAKGGVLATIVKCAGLGAVVGTLGASAALDFTPPDPQPVSRPSAAPARATQSEPDRALAVRAPSRPAEPEAEPELARNEPAPRQRARAREHEATLDTAVQRADAASALREEALLIDRARDALAARNAAGALRALELHRERFARPLFRPEALYLRMQALRLRGDHETARRVARQLLSAYPNGAQASAVRSFLESDP